MINVCSHVDCTAEATCSLEAAGPDGLVMDVVGLCRPHRDAFLDGWARMQAAAGALRDQGVTQPELGRIMSARIDAGEFQ